LLFIIVHLIYIYFPFILISSDSKYLFKSLFLIFFFLYRHHRVHCEFKASTYNNNKKQNSTSFSRFFFFDIYIYIYTLFLPSIIKEIKNRKKMSINCAHSKRLLAAANEEFRSLPPYTSFRVYIYILLYEFFIL